MKLNKKEKEINGFVIREEEVVEKDDGVRLMPIDEEDRNSATVFVQMEKPSEKVIKKVTVELDGEVYPVSGYSFEWLCRIAEESREDICNILFD